MSETYISAGCDTLRSLHKSLLGEILAELENVPPGHYCTVRIGKDLDGNYSYLYGVYTMTPEEYDNYRRNGGVWGHNTPEYYQEIIEEEFSRRGIGIVAPGSLRRAE